MHINTLDTAIKTDQRRNEMRLGAREIGSLTIADLCVYCTHYSLKDDYYNWTVGLMKKEAKYYNKT